MRIKEKVKDIVEVRPFTPVDGATSAPAEVLSGYRFTDITADLMGKWLDAALAIRTGSGSALALAGFRGVGKTHFLSAFAAILHEPELRTQIAEQHVATVAAQMSRRRYTVVTIRRGSRETLIEEMQDAVASLSGGEAPASLNELLQTAAEARTHDTPLVIIIDTAAGRDSQVRRDDGPLLSEIGEAAKTMGMFVGLALDDDIAGADGANRAISRVYSIDYLDQEHLHKIVDSHIFAKKERALPILQDIYREFHDGIPRFRWSEQRFKALYPMHPGVLEIAPLIRIFIKDFAMLSFAADAGTKILGRPANSLIGLEEVFDAAESRLRNAPELKRAFETYDRTEKEVIATLPVGSRLPAKFVLKGLFMLSLDGRGSTAEELGAAMLVNPGSIDLHALLDSFAAATPEGIYRSTDEVPTYRIAIADEESLDAVISDAAISEADIVAVLLQHAKERYSDLGLSESTISFTSVEWRGTIRRGSVHWLSEDDRCAAAQTDWQVLVLSPDADDAESVPTERPCLRLRPAELTASERKTIARLHVLQNDEEVREQLGEKLGPETQIQAMALERIWKRVFLEDSTLTVDGIGTRFGEAALSAHTLAELFTEVLTSAFERRFPEHPVFERTLTAREAGHVISKFLASNEPSDDGRALGLSFALPLGLAMEAEGGLARTPAADLKEIPAIAALFERSSIEDRVVSLPEVAGILGDAPFGLGAEEQHLILAALVGQRELEFVTSSGNRINHRSLDLQIIWDDIEGVARPYDEVYASERLVEWAQLLTGNSQLRTIKSLEDRLIVIDTLAGWLVNWEEAKFLEAFENLPDQYLNSTIWRIAESTRRTFGRVATAITDLTQDTITLDETLTRVADIFSDSVDEYERRKRELLVLRHHTDAVRRRRFMQDYVALSEPTTDVHVETARAALIDRLGAGTLAQDPAETMLLETAWSNFYDRYVEHYLDRHLAVENLADGLRSILAGARWGAFEVFADLEVFDRQFVAAASSVVRRSRTRSCDVDAAKILEQQPFCTCSLSLERYDPRRNNVRRLEVIIERGLNHFAARLNEDLGLEHDADSLAALDADEIAQLRARVVKTTASVKGRSTVDELRELLPDVIEDWELDELPIFADRG